jgi:seryl-tRNA synthetase
VQVVTTTRPVTEAFRDEMLGAGLLIAGPVDGVYGRSGAYEKVADAVEDLITRRGADDVEDYVRFPPVLPRTVFERTGYLSSFPDLMGSIHSFGGDDRQHAEMLARAEAGEEWARSLDPTEVMLCSAACHNVYPGLTGVLPEEGRTLQIVSWCFRHEPSRELTRMQSFRMVEYVFVGSASDAVVVRNRWIERTRNLLVDVGLKIDMVTANDPFFGRGGRILARSQRDEELKFEFVTPFDPGSPPVAIASSNLHQDHFGDTFAISTPSGDVAHSTCIGWGLDRIVLALFHHHGTDPARWPHDVRAALWP